MQISVRLLTGLELLIQIESSDTIDNLKWRIEDKYGYPVHEQRLIYKGHAVEGDRTLAECDIQHDAELRLQLRLRGD